MMQFLSNTAVAEDSVDRTEATVNDICMTQLDKKAQSQGTPNS